MAMAYKWIGSAVGAAIHAEQMAAHGGGEGVRDIGLLESALARPLQLASYDESDIVKLAAAYAYGISRNHPFTDGNKRTAAVVSETFISLNGYRLTATDIELVDAILALASGTLSEFDLENWFRSHIEIA
jgi:death on curing protein